MKLVEPLQNEKGEDIEPALHFHEFLFLLGLIAKNSMKSAKNNIQTKLRDFYVEKLGLEAVDLNSIEDLRYDDVLAMAENDDYGSDDIDGDEMGDEWPTSENEQEEAGMTTFGKKQKRQQDDYIVGNQKLVMNLIEDQNKMEQSIMIDWD